MKKIILALLIALFSCSAVFGQNVDWQGIPIHNVSVQVADGIVPDVFAATAMTLGIAFVAPVVAVAGGDANDVNFSLEGLTPFMSVAYDYHFPDTRWNLGGELGYWHCCLVTNESKQHIHFNTATVTGKFFYKPEGCCKLYAGANAGIGTVFNGEEVSPLPVVQLTPIGMRLGWERVAFTAEAGVGYKGFAQIGITVGL